MRKNNFKGQISDYFRLVIWYFKGFRSLFKIFLKYFHEKIDKKPVKTKLKNEFEIEKLD